VILCIADILSPSALKRVRQKIAKANFEDGKKTAGWQARLVKQNTQISRHEPALAELRPLVESALLQHPLVQMAAFPNALAPILFNCYEPGMSYGTHVDNAFMGERPYIRSDISATLFLSEPDSYGGGELVIESSQGEQAFKLAAGTLVLYPSTSLHRVEPVITGQRLAAVIWMQSLIRDPRHREILFDLDTARQQLFGKLGATAELDLLAKTYANLLRLWGEP
jgi:PKHD-type hydroxylase